MLGSGGALDRGERLLQEGPGRRIVVEAGGTVRKTFTGADAQRTAAAELARLTRFAAALADVPGVSCPRPLGPVEDPGPGYRMSWVDGVDLCEHLRRPVPPAELDRLGRTIGAVLRTYVEAVGEPYTDLKLGNVLVGRDGALAFCDVGLPDGAVPPLDATGAAEVSVGNLLASLLFDSARPGWFWRRRVHRQSAVLAAALVAGFADAGRPLDPDALRAATDQAYRRITFDRRSPLRTAWYATAGRLLGIRLRTSAGVLRPAPYRRR